MTIHDQPVKLKPFCKAPASSPEGFAFDSLEELEEWMRQAYPVPSEHLVYIRDKEYRMQLREGGMDLKSTQLDMFMNG